MWVKPDAVCGGEGLHDEVSSAAVPGSPLLGLLVEGRDVGLAANGSKQGEGGCAGALHTHVLEDAACSAGLHSFRKHCVGSLVYATTQPCNTKWLLSQVMDTETDARSATWKFVSIQLSRVAWDGQNIGDTCNGNAA